MDKLYAAIDAALTALVNDKRVCRRTMLAFAAAGTAMACFEATFPFFGLAWGMATCLLIVDMARWQDDRDREDDG
jgi:hypothetical protein